MNATQSLAIYKILSKHFKNEDEARVVVEQIEQVVEEKINQKKDIFLTKDDKIDIMKSIYIVGIIQFLAIVGSIIGLINIYLKK